MKVGDIIKIVTWRHHGEPDQTGLIIRIGMRHNNRQVATVLNGNGEIETWPLDSHYEIEVISEKMALAE